jgi:hypothetical protein
VLNLVNFEIAQFVKHQIVLNIPSLEKPLENSVKHYYQKQKMGSELVDGYLEPPEIGSLAIQNFPLSDLQNFEPTERFLSLL